jgi:hypothetical protein
VAVVLPVYEHFFLAAAQENVYYSVLLVLLELLVFHLVHEHVFFEE